MLNKTLLALAKKTALARNKNIYIWIVIVLCGAFGLLGVVYARMHDEPNFGSQRVRYTRLTTEDTREKGLSGRVSLPTEEVMLFVFPEPGLHCFWMKDMQFPIDMIWLDSKKEVIKIESAVQPSTYPERFCPDQPARYVVEVNAGQAQRAGVTVGTRLQF